MEFKHILQEKRLFLAFFLFFILLRDSVFGGYTPIFKASAIIRCLFFQLVVVTENSLLPQQQPTGTAAICFLSSKLRLGCFLVVHAVLKPAIRFEKDSNQHVTTQLSAY